MAKHGNKRDIALLIDSRMREKGLSAKALAEECGVSVQTVNNWRNGTMPNDDALPKLADALDLSVSEILAGEIKAIDDKAEGRLEKKIKSLSLTTGTSLCIIIGLMMMFVVMYVTCAINLLFGKVLEHSVGYFAWVVVSAAFVFGGAYLAISGLRTAEKAESQQTR